MSKVTQPHLADIICNTLWGSQLTFAPFSVGKLLIPFESLWPDDETLVATYRDAGLEQGPYEICKLFLASSSFKALETLLKEKLIPVTQVFSPGHVTLAHLACALCLHEMVRMVSRVGGNGSSSGNEIWSVKDEEGRTPEDVCSNQELCKKIPHRSIFVRKKMPVHQPLKPGDQERIFQQASDPDRFYAVVVSLKTYCFDVNKETSVDGDLLIHVAVQGGLSSLPLLLTLVNHFRADVNARNGNGMSPLSLACQLGHMRVAEVLVCVLGADVTVRATALEQTALHFAVLHNHPDIVSMLLRRGVDAGSEDKNSCDATHLARRVGAHECRQLLTHHIKERISLLTSQAVLGTLDISSLHSHDICLIDDEGYTFPMLAAKHGHSQLLKQLVRMENCPLDYRQMKTPDLLDHSMELSASLKGLPRSDEHPFKTALHYAAQFGHSECVRVLLEAHAHPALPDSNAWLPLHYACDGEHVECVRIIVEQKRTLGLSGLRPAMTLAKEQGNQSILKILQGAATRRQSELVTPVLFDVAVSGNSELLFKILENGDDVNPSNESRDWPLLLAAGFGYLDIVQQLHQFGGKITTSHPISGSTPLHVAARGGHRDVVDFLLQFTTQGGSQEGSMDINARNKAGATALELAASQGHSQIVRVLLDTGASCCLPDSTSRLLSCPGFSGTQFLLETYRKERMKKLSTILERKQPLKDFENVWQGPWDFNLRSETGDTVLMVAAEHGMPEITRFLLTSASLGQPGMFVPSSGMPQSLPESVSPSPDESDHMSDHPAPRTPEQQKRLQDSWETDWPMTALPRPLHHKRRYTETRPGRGRKPRPPVRLPPKVLFRKSSGPSGGSNATSSEEEGAEPPPVMATPVPRNSGICSAIIRAVNPHDRQTALHRAAHAGQTDNVILLLKADPECANAQDRNGDTAIHLACQRTQRKQYRRTVEALLSCDKVCVSLRNRHQRLPEEDCPNSRVRKMVAKQRAKDTNTPSMEHPSAVDLPSPPSAVHKKPPGALNAGLGGIPEVRTPTPSQSSEVLSLSAFDEKMKNLKDRFNKLDSSASEHDTSN